MNIRKDPYYRIRCNQEGNIKTLDIDATGPNEIINLVVGKFSGKFTPAKDKNGKVTSEQIFTNIDILYCDNTADTEKLLTQGRIYQHCPEEIIECITKTITKRP